MARSMWLVVTRSMWLVVTPETCALAKFTHCCHIDKLGNTMDASIGHNNAWLDFV